jgi:hypothetical protein
MEDEFQARVGDEVSVESHRLRGGRRAGTILEVLGVPGHEYYRVRWQDGRETVFHPGGDAVVVPKAPRRRRKPAGRAEKRPAPQAPRAVEASEGPRQVAFRAVPGDRLVIHGHHLGEPDRDAEILEAIGEDGTAPFRVRWSDSGRETLLFPGTDAVIDHIAKKPGRRSAPKRA